MTTLNWSNNIEKLVKVGYNIFNPPLLVNINEKYFLKLLTNTTCSSIIISERRFKVMENITIGNSTYNVFDIHYRGKGIVFSIDGMFINFVTDTLLKFHNVHFTIIEWNYNPINMMTEVFCSLNAGYPYNPKNNIIEEAIIKALREKRPIYGLAEDIQEDIEEKQWLSQMRYLI